MVKSRTSDKKIEHVRLSEVLSALSYALDIVEGQPEGHVLRSCYIGMKIGERLGLSEEDRSALFYALLLKDAGCSSNASKITALFGSDDFETKKAFKTVDWSRLPHAVKYVASTVSPDGAIWTKARRFFAVGLEGQKGARQLVLIRCERGAEIVRLMGFPEASAQAIRNLDEHWNGHGHPDGLRRDEIPLLSRICGLAQTAEVFYSGFGPARAEEVAKARRKTWFDPDVVDAFLSLTKDGSLWKDIRAPELGPEISRLEPEDQVVEVTPERLDLVAEAFSQIIDAKSPFTYTHSEGVTEVAVAIAKQLDFEPEALRDLKRAALLHDIGKLGVSNSILDKPGRLTDEEFGIIKNHPRLTYGILSRVSAFQPIAQTAANHHEKLDGTGYHRGITGDDLDRPSRILAVADIFDALSKDRPYRAAMPMEKVISILDSDSGDKLCPESVDILKELIEKDVL
jgi:putative nucleotidyltransferase with HDIG domain